MICQGCPDTEPLLSRLSASPPPPPPLYKSHQTPPPSGTGQAPFRQVWREVDRITKVLKTLMADYAELRDSTTRRQQSLQDEVAALKLENQKLSKIIVSRLDSLEGPLLSDVQAKLIRHDAGLETARSAATSAMRVAEDVRRHLNSQVLGASTSALANPATMRSASDDMLMQRLEAKLDLAESKMRERIAAVDKELSWRVHDEVKVVNGAVEENSKDMRSIEKSLASAMNELQAKIAYAPPPSGTLEIVPAALAEAKAAAAAAQDRASDCKESMRGLRRLAAVIVDGVRSSKADATKMESALAASGEGGETRFQVRPVYKRVAVSNS